MMFPTGCLPSASCAALVLLACRFLIRSAHPSRPSPRRACRASVRYSPVYLVLPPRPAMLTNRACPSRLIRSSASPVRLALLTLPVSRVGGRGVLRLALISSCVSSAVSAFRLSSSWRAYRYTECCGDGDRRMWGIRASVS